MARAQNKTLTMSDYLDIWRGAFYSVLMGIIYNEVIQNTELFKDFFKWLLLFGITFFIIVDGIVRFKSRNYLRQRLVDTTGIIELSWFVPELVGMGILIYGAYNFIKTIPATSQGLLAVGIFSFIAIIHNFALIEQEAGSDEEKKKRGQRGWDFIRKSIWEDASEIPQVSSRWRPILWNKRISVYTKLRENKEDFQKLVVEGQDIKLKNVIKFFFCKPKEAFGWAKIHYLYQFTALHVIVLNFIATFCILMPEFFKVKLAKAILVSVFFTIVALLFYYYVSTKEVSRFQGGELLGEPSKKEKICQRCGNCFLIASFGFLYIALPKLFLVGFILIQQTAFGIAMIKEIQTKQD